MNQYINENLSGVDWLITNLGTRLRYIIEGIEDAIKHRELDLSFWWREGGLMLYNYKRGYDKPFSNREPERFCRAVMKEGIESYNGIVIEFKVDGTRINYYDCSGLGPCDTVDLEEDNYLESHDSDMVNISLS